LVIFQGLFKALGLKRRLQRCFKHLGRKGVYGIHTIFMILIIHILIGHRRLREVAYYKDDPMVLRLLGLRRMPDVATITRNMGSVDMKGCDKTEKVIREIVLDRLVEDGCARVTLDYDGSVYSSRRAAEGTAVGYNKLRKGERGYYPLLCTVAQTGQGFGMLPRSGNIHDSNGSQDFIVECVASVIERLPRARIESRLDSAHFSEETVCLLNNLGVEFSVSVPFLRFPELKEVIESRRRWGKIDKTWSYFEYDWAPKKWSWAFRFVIYRQRVKVKRKGALQLDVFEPREWEYEYKAVVTNKRCSVGYLLAFHHGRGSQEGIIGELKTHCQFDYIPTRRWAANRLYGPCQIPLDLNPVTGFAGWEKCLSPPQSFDTACFPAMGVLMEGIECCPEAPISVCCVGQECFLIPEGECSDIGGEYHPEWNSCDPNPCVPSPSATTSWGVLKKLYR